ncbi:AAA family ATPase [Nocardia sp. XZ_19_369]|uniref:AAA family ATPase n=1 Tax=Nocardia sp. XZ_19_369 TaxID=2769487 RepID=UPI00188EE665|nr:AAA family ATPase [Nocardia sp. XZ_19_369]
MPDDSFSLTRVRLRHYRSIADADVELGPLLLLVGPNGSGKSNFLDALRLVSESLQTSLDQALRSRGGVAEVRRRSTGHPTHFAIDLEFLGRDEVVGSFNGSYGFEVATTRGGGFRVSREYCNIWLANRKNEGVRTADSRYRIEKGELVDQSYSSPMPPIDDQRLYLIAVSGYPELGAVFAGLSGISVFNMNPAVMRQPQVPDSGKFLRRDGSNIASVLHALEPARESVTNDLSRIENYLEQIVPGMRGVSRVDLGNWETVEFLQDVPGAKFPWRFQAQSVSDGTLRALGVLVALFAGTRRTLSPIGIEEPESALHPAAGGVLMDALRDASERRQVIVTSHSPDLLDRHDIDASELRAVRSVAGETVIGKLDSAGLLALREQLYTPGELLRTDQLLPGRPDDSAGQVK